MVDDSSTQREGVRELLEKHYAVETFNDAGQMLERLSAGPPPEVLLLSWLLPDISGLDVCRRVRESYDDVTLPILMLSVRGNPDGFAEGLRAGANDCIARPFSDSELLARVANLLRLRAQVQRLREREDSLSTTLASIGDAVITTDRSGRISFLNPVAERLTGWSSTEAQQRPLEEVFRVKSPLHGLAEPRVLIRKDGTEVPIEDSAAPRHTGSGGLWGDLLVFRDVTEQLQARQRTEALTERLRASEAELSRLLDAIPLLVSFVGADERYGRVNKAYEDWFGIPREDLRGRQVRDVIGEAAYAVLGPYVKRGLAGESFSFEQHGVPYRLGGTRDVKVSFVAHREPGQPVEGYVALLQDVTRERSLEREREQLLDATRQAQLHAEAERAKLHAIFQRAPAAICLLEGPEHRYVLANPLYQALIANRAVLGKTVAEALPEVVEQGFIRLLDDVYRTGVPFVGKETYAQLQRVPGGPLEEVYVNFVYQFIPGVDGKTHSILAHIVEVTDLVRSRQAALQAAEALRVSEQRLGAALGISGSGTWELDLQRQHVTMDPRMRTLFGFSAEGPFELARVLSVIHPDDVAAVERGIAQALAGENSGALELEYRTLRLPGGQDRWVSFRGQASFDAAGAPVRFLGTSIDITTRKDAEAERTALLTTIANQNLFGVAVLRGPELRFELANEGYKQIVGNRDVLGKPLLEALPELAGQRADSMILEVMRTGQPVTAREQCFWIDSHGTGTPEPRYYSFTWQALPSLKGPVDSVLVLTHDVTSIVQAREREKTLAREATARSDFEQQLIGIVSHDLRNPLGAILLGAERLKRQETLEPNVRKTVERIQASASRAVRLVKELLDFTQARLGGGIRIERIPTDLHALSRTVVEEVEEAHPTARLEVVTRGDGKGFWDADRLSQVLQNLVTNAVKYGQPGALIQVELHGDESQVTLRVHNEGAPIPPERLPDLFQPLQRGSDAADVAGRSVGLGLFIVKAIVDAHQGHIAVTSTQAEGTTFAVSLPRQAAESPGQPGSTGGAGVPPTSSGTRS